MDREPFLTERLFCPGPTPVPLAAHLAAMASSVYHRSEDFYKVFQGARTGLQPVFGSSAPPIILTSSGTGAMEAAVVNFTNPGDRTLVVNAGKFGERWEKLTKKYGCNTQVLTIPWGKCPELTVFDAAIAGEKGLKAVFFQANETSTGVQLPVRELAVAVRRSHPDCLIVVDAISSLVAHQMEMDQWDLDVVVAGSQKGFGIPPGLSFVAVSKRAWGKLSTQPRFYFDLKKERDEQEKGSGAWTCATTLVQALNQALIQIHGIGLERVLATHRQRAKAVRAAAGAMGLNMFPTSGFSHALSAICVPEGVDGKQLLSTLRKKFGFIFAGGQDQLAGKIVRFSHLGFMDRFDVLSGVAGLEFALKDCGHSIKLGAGVGAAMDVFATDS